MSKKIYKKNNSINPNFIELLKQENASLTKMYKEALIKMKQMQNEYESMYSRYINENQMRENNIKSNYNKYQDLLQRHFEKEETNYLEEIKNLKYQIQEKDKIISILQNNNALLNDKLTKNELIYNLKEKEYQKQLLNKDRLLMKSSDVVKKNSQEVMEDIRKLKEEIKYFQNKVNSGNNINNDDSKNLNHFNNEYKKGQIKKSFSSINFNNIKPYMNINNINNAKNNNKNNIRNYQSNQTSPLSIKNKILNNSNEISKLKIRIINLINIIKQKDKEILFWKNLRQDLYFANKTQNFDNYNFCNTNYYSNNNTNNYRSVNSEQKILKRCYSQASGQNRPNKRKKINLYLIDSNINKPIKRNIVTYKNHTNQ